MNHPSEWQKIYHPRIGKYVYKHKGTGVITDSLFSIGRNLKKPLLAIMKKTGKKVAEKGINKASDVVVKKAGDRIGNILRNRAKRPGEAEGKSKRATQQSGTRREEMMRLNNLLSKW